MVRSRSPSSSPVRAGKSPSGPLSPPPRSSSIESAAEAALETISGIIPGADSPPQSAQSMKDTGFLFRYSLKRRTDSSKPSSQPPPVSQKPTAMPSPLCLSPTNPFNPPAYDKPKPLVTSPDKKTNSPKSLVKSRIHMFTMSEENKPKPTIPALAPPPIPPRQRVFAKSYTVDADNGAPVTSPTSASKPFTSRERQRPFSPTDKQRAISKLLLDQPVSEPSAFPILSHGYQSAQPQTSDPYSSSSTTSSKGNTESSNRSDKIRQSYVSSRCSSDESLTEFSSLLKDDEKSASRSSVCIYFDGKDIPDTLV